jgi:hypothetical protein
MNEPKFKDYGQMMEYIAGNFHYVIWGKDVEVSKDTPGGMIESVNVYHYNTYEQAEKAAYRMAKLQANA